jgi:hypothetical protein
MPVDLEPRSELPPEFCPAPPTLEGTLLDDDAPEWAAVLRAARHALYITDGRGTMLLPLVIHASPAADATLLRRTDTPARSAPGPMILRFLRSPSSPVPTC